MGGLVNVRLLPV